MTNLFGYCYNKNYANPILAHSHPKQMTDLQLDLQQD